MGLLIINRLDVGEHHPEMMTPFWQSLYPVHPKIVSPEHSYEQCIDCTQLTPWQLLSPESKEESQGCPPLCGADAPHAPLPSSEQIQGGTANRHACLHLVPVACGPWAYGTMTEEGLACTFRWMTSGTIAYLSQGVVGAFKELDGSGGSSSPKEPWEGTLFSNSSRFLATWIFTMIAPYQYSYLLNILL